MKPDFLITIDGGTTNTRATLWKEDEVTAVAAREVGARDMAVSSGKSPLKTAVRECIEETLEKGGVSYDDNSAVVASGMLTSNVGLVEIPHLFAPVDAKTLASNIKKSSWKRYVLFRSTLFPESKIMSRTSIKTRFP